MVLQASDELRHPSGPELPWRESLYFNFNDARNGIGGWIYLWVVPNQPQPSGMLVSFYHGHWPDLAVNEKAMAAPGHRLQEDGRWIYCFQRNIGELIADDFDDFEICGLRLRRIEPLKRYAITFDDGEGNGFDFECRFTSPPFDYGDGVNPTPPWMAQNRYHRSHDISGRLRIAGESYDVDCHGDSDHSWGLRDMATFGDNLFKMWSLQTDDGKLTLSVLQQGVGDTDIALGFVAIDGEMASARTVESRTRFDRDGVQNHVELVITDDRDRTIRATMGELQSFVGWGTADHFWGYEGVGTYEVKGHGTVKGLSSYFWPARVTPAALHRGEWR
nr:hypothetical protein [Sphingomonas sp. Y57]